MELIGPTLKHKGTISVLLYFMSSPWVKKISIQIKLKKRHEPNPWGLVQSYRHIPKCEALLIPKRQRKEFKNCLLESPYWSGKSAEVCNWDKYQVQIQGLPPPMWTKLTKWKSNQQMKKGKSSGFEGIKELFYINLDPWIV